MLDDIKQIAQRDASDALGVAEKQPKQLRHNFGVSVEADGIINVVIAGMGGSAIAGNLLLNWPRPTLPVVVSRSYDLPAFVTNQTLCIISSYSGETEEALSALAQAQERGCRIAVITDGGQLKAAAEANDYPFARVPAGIQPRLAVWYMYRALLEIMQSIGAVGSDSIEQLEAASHQIESATEAWRADTPSSQNYAKQLAMDIAGKTAVIYAGSAFSTAAYKWKINCNENAKNVAFWNVLPEANHNEFLGWTSHPVEKPFTVIELLSSFDHPQVQKRFSAMNSALSGRMPHPIAINAVGDSHLAQLLWVILLGDFASIYLAIVNNVDPTQVDGLEKFKKAIAL